jgi:hypothetical protein
VGAPRHGARRAWSLTTGDRVPPKAGTPS